MKKSRETLNTVEVTPQKRAKMIASVEVVMIIENLSAKKRKTVTIVTIIEVSVVSVMISGVGEIVTIEMTEGRREIQMIEIGIARIATIVMIAVSEIIVVEMNVKVDVIAAEEKSMARMSLVEMNRTEMKIEVAVKRLDVMKKD
jgi:hypothetical protein